MTDKVVFKCHAGGLGDSLLYSTLPKRWHQEHGAEFYVATHFRNQEIADVVWGNNPYFKGFLDYNGPFTHLMSDDERLSALCAKNENSIKGAEEFFGFAPQNSFPELYISVELRPEFMDKTLVDIGAITAPFSKVQIEKYFERLVELRLIDPNKCIFIDTGQSHYEPGTLDFLPKRQTPGLAEYCNWIYSCKNFVTVSSGASALASAIRFGYNDRLRIFALIHNAIENKKIWRWQNILYFPTGASYDDWAKF